MQIIGRQQETGQAAETVADEARPSTYEAPRVVQLGQSNDLIRGNWTSGSWDTLQGSLQWYISGE
jgi:hypothetical protein